MGPEIEIEVVPLAEVPMEELSWPVRDVPTVLVVDDELLVCETVAAVLATSGLRVFKADNATAALEIVRRGSPDLLLTDVMMPGVTGVELAMTVATEFPGCRILLFSGHASANDLAAARNGGFDFPLLAKPVHPVELLRQVFHCLDWQPQLADSQRISSAQLPLPASMQTHRSL